MFGFPVADFSRMFFNYSYETVKITDLNEALIDQSCLLRATGCSTISSVGDLSQLTLTQIEVLRRNPFVLRFAADRSGRQRTISKVTPSFVHNTVDNPIFPNQGKRLTALDRSRGARRQHELPQAAPRGDLLQAAPGADVVWLPRAGRVHRADRHRAVHRRHRPGRATKCCRSSSVCSSAANTACAASTSARSARRCQARSPCWAATRACSSTPST